MHDVASATGAVVHLRPIPYPRQQIFRKFGVTLRKKPIPILAAFHSESRPALNKTFDETKSINYLSRQCDHDVRHDTDAIDRACRRLRGRH
ncbi:hypothetical protein BCAR13_660013 [Paraburkholderia caribensis]|nr:hypothetical protein BCAR13_660013 [Paraburkholderia caribensis]